MMELRSDDITVLMTSTTFAVDSISELRSYLRNPKFTAKDFSESE